MFFSIITKNSNWEILTQNVVTFNREDGVLLQLALYSVQCTDPYQIDTSSLICRPNKWTGL